MQPSLFPRWEGGYFLWISMLRLNNALKMFISHRENTDILRTKIQALGLQGILGPMPELCDLEILFYPSGFANIIVANAVCQRPENSYSKLHCVEM